MSVVDSICEHNHDPRFRAAVTEAYESGKAAMEQKLVEFDTEVNGNRFWRVKIDAEGLTITAKDGTQDVVVHRSQNWSHTATFLALALAEIESLTGKLP